MTNAVAIVTHSGFGKSTAIGHIKADEQNRLAQDIEGLNPAETLLINIKGKALPYPGWKAGYKRIDETSPTEPKGNYLVTTDPAIIIRIMNYYNAYKPQMKNVVIDDFQYLMAEEFMTNALKVGYEKFSRMAKNAYDVINTGLKLRDDINFFVLAHSEETRDSYKMKTIGKMLDEKVTLEGLFPIILYGKEEFNSTEKRVKKQFVTNFDGQYPAKSPIGMFEDLYIPNDLGLVSRKIREYYKE